MNRICRTAAGLAMVAAFCLIGNVLSAKQAAQQPPAQGQTPGQTQEPKYTMAEYNAYQACLAEKNTSQQVKCLDDFVAKYPNSQLLVYIYQLYYTVYNQLKNYPKVIESADKLLALGDKAEPATRFQAYFARAYAYTNMTNPDAGEATKAREAAQAGLKILDQVKKPDKMSEEDFAKEKQKATILFQYTAGLASMVLKDCSGAVEHYKAVLGLTPDDFGTNYKLGQAYLCTNPPKQMDAFWFLARAVTAKGAMPQQTNQVKTYLRKLLVNYQQAACDNLVDAEMNELVQLAGSSAERPASYTLAGSADLDSARKNMTIASVIGDLKTGGDKAKVTWLAACGLEFPDVPGKLIDVAPGSDAVQLRVAFVTSEAEFEAKNTPDMDVKVVGQPDAARLKKDNPVRFTGTLVGYNPDPFMLHWDKVKVNAEDIPKEEQKKTPPRRRPPTTKKPNGPGL